MAISVSNARTALENRKRDISDVSDALFLQWSNQINYRAWRMLQDVDPEQFVTTGTISVTSGTNTYSLAADFDNIRPLNCGIYRHDSNGDPEETPLAMTNYQSSVTGYYLKGTSIVFTPKPTRSDTYTVRYIPTLDALANISDTFVIPDQFKEALIDAFEVLYDAWDEEYGLESISDQRYMRSLADMINNYRSDSSSFLLPDFSAIY